MNEFNVLLGAATNGTPSGSLFDALFARYIASQESWRELESPLPITILAAGEDLIDYRIYGNTENGESVGERTENVFNFEELMAAPAGFVASVMFTHCLIMHLKPNTKYTMLSNGYGALDGDSNLNRSIYFNFSDAQAAVFAAHPVTAMTDSNGELRVGLLSERSNAQQYINNTAQVWCVEGSTAPTSYIPYGYKLPMMVRSENLLNQDADGWQRSFYINGMGDAVYNVFFDASPYIEIVPGTVYTLVSKHSGTGVYNAFYDVNKIFISSFEAFGQKLHTATAPPNAKYIRCSVLAINRYPDTARRAMLIEGDTEPPAYIPYYRDEENIYIGSDPLAEDEYVDFGEQKIYRMEGGTLTPTDPPVPIPALPTIEGETIIDYNPSETPAVEPEKMYVKYKPQEMIQ